MSDCVLNAPSFFCGIGVFLRSSKSDEQRKASNCVAVNLTLHTAAKLNFVEISLKRSLNFGAPNSSAQVNVSTLKMETFNKMCNTTKI